MEEEGHTPGPGWPAPSLVGTLAVPNGGGRAYTGSRMAGSFAGWHAGSAEPGETRLCGYSKPLALAEDLLKGREVVPVEAPDNHRQKRREE